MWTINWDVWNPKKSQKQKELQTCQNDHTSGKHWMRLFWNATCHQEYQNVDLQDTNFEKMETRRTIGNFRIHTFAVCEQSFKGGNLKLIWIWKLILSRSNLFILRYFFTYIISCQKEIEPWTILNDLFIFKSKLFQYCCSISSHHQNNYYFMCSLIIVK